jgi:glycerol-3-phosphate acyltransferase PlsY
VTELVLPFLLGVALGSVPFAWLAVRWRTGRDVGAEGSGNVGALNSMRVARSPAVGIAVLLLDAAKGAVAVLLARAWFPVPHADLAAMVGAVAGHDYNPWLSLARGRVTGGKGFATAGGALAPTLPWLIAAWLLLSLLAWAAFRAARGITDEAPATATATLLLPLVAFLVHGLPWALACLALALLILPKHVREVRALLGVKHG